MGQISTNNTIIIRLGIKQAETFIFALQLSSRKSIFHAYDSLPIFQNKTIIDRNMQCTLHGMYIMFIKIPADAL